MKKIIFCSSFAIVLSAIYFTLFPLNRLNFRDTHDGERIGNTNFYYRDSTIMNGKNGNVVAIDKNGESPREDYAKYFSSVATIYHHEKIFIITNAHTTGSGGYDEHQVFKIFDNKITYLGQHMSCNLDVKIEQNKILFSVYGFHCEYFDFMERDGDITTSRIDLN